MNRNIGIIWRIRNSIDKNTKILLYYALIHSYLNYGSCIWGAASNTQLKPLIISQKKVVRILASVHRREHTNGIFKNLKLLKLTDLIKLSIVKFVQKQINCQNPIIPYRPANNLHGYNTRFAHYLRPRRPMNYVARNFIAQRGCNVWNSLPENLKNVVNQNTFKIKAKKYFINAY